MNYRIILVTGVSGTGKTTVGELLAERLKAQFYDGDSFHPEENVTKMTAGIPLNDLDREPWLKNINSLIREKSNSETVVIGCSALKERYRNMLREGVDQARLLWVHLQGEYDVIYERMSLRPNHFMSADMLRSQFDAYEPPQDGLMISVDQDLEKIINQIMSAVNISKTEVGLIGLGVMGTSLARNIARNGFSISIYNRHLAGKEEVVAQKQVQAFTELKAALPFDDLIEFVGSLKTPRKIILMVNAGRAVDDVLNALEPLLEANDVVVDGGNSLYKDTEARQERLGALGIYFVGAGVSGGEEGALVGPSIMPGGSRQGFESISDVLLAIAARNDQHEICCDYIGEGGAGHFVKMVHNGIEYAEMQLLAEVYSHLRYDQGKQPDEIADLLETWNRADAASYLLGITIDILRFKDVDGMPLIDKISGVAGSKGTGGWTTMAACELGVPVPAMAEALFSRYLSSYKQDRVAYDALYGAIGDPISIDPEDLLHTYMFCRIMNHDQGFRLIQQASDSFNWKIDSAMLLKVWSGGCIIRSGLLKRLREGWFDGGSNILAHPYVLGMVKEHHPRIKQTVSTLTLSTLGFPVICSSLEYFKCLTNAHSNANIIQAQRDYFGAHTYQRTDDPSGSAHHTKWI